MPGPTPIHRLLPLAAAALLLLARAAPARAQDAADRAWAAGNVQEATRLYEQRLAADSGDVRALHRVALSRAWAGKYDEALALLDRALRITPNDAETRLDRARVLAWKGDSRAAVEALDPILQANPTYLPALQARAQFLSWAGDFSASLQTYGRILEIAPGDRGVGLERARVLSWASRFGASEAAYDSLLRRNPQDRDALLGLAQVLAWAGRLDSAEVVYRRVLDVNRNDVEGMHGLARVAAWRGDLRTAERRWRDALARNPEDVDALVGLSQTLRWEGRDAAALDAARHAVRASPTNRDARAELAWARLPTRPSVSPAATYETDSDGNRITTFASGGTLRPDPRLELRADAYWRDARLANSAVPDAQARGVALGLRTQVEPGWSLSGGAGVSTSDVAGAETRPSWRAAASTPGRLPVTATLAFNHTPLDATAVLIQRQVDVNELNLSAQLVPAQGWSVSAGGGGADFHGRVSGQTNRRTNGNLAVTRRFARYFTLGAAGRAFGFDRDLNDGYFDPDLYWIGEALARANRDWRKVGVSLELAPGVQQVRRGGDRGATLRTTGGLTYTVAPGRSLGVSAAYANAGLQRLSPTTASGGGYRYTAVSVSGRWAF
jgi:tetratricopeptide (TPR) repeat protein